MDSERILSLVNNTEITRSGLAGAILDVECMLRRVDLDKTFRLKLQVMQSTLQVIAGEVLPLLEPIEGEIRRATLLAECGSTILEM